MRRITTTDFGDLLARARRIVDAVLLALPDVLLGVIVLAVFVAAAWGLGRLVAAVLHRSGQPRGVQLVFGRLVRGAVVTIGVAVAVALTIVFPTLNAASLFGALGVTSVAIGFVFKDVFQNLLAGLLILLTRPFRIGDQIVTGEHEGTVDDIQVRATLLRTYDNRRVVIPNSELYTNRVVVNTAHDRRRLAVGVGVDEDLDDVERRIVTVIGGLDGVLADPAPVVLVSALGDFSTLFDVRFWNAPTVRREAVEVTDAALAAIEADLDAAGVDLPYPCSGCSWSGSRRGDPQPAR